jgi:hypothetical protein
MAQPGFGHTTSSSLPNSLSNWGYPGAADYNRWRWGITALNRDKELLMQIGCFLSSEERGPQDLVAQAWQAQEAGHIGDYIAWWTAGASVLGGICLVALR